MHLAENTHKLRITFTKGGNSMPNHSQAQNEDKAQTPPPGQLSLKKNNGENMTITSPSPSANVTTSLSQIPPFQLSTGMSVADKIYSLIDRHCIITDHEKAAVTLWILSSWVLDEFRIFPRLALISPEKRCGKSTLLEVINCTTENPTMVSNASTAVLSRIAAKKPTLILDEADTFIKGGEPGLIGLINSGHSKATAHILKCDGDNYEPKKFSTWMPVVLASIGDLADTIMDRSVRINMRRKLDSESVHRLPPDLKTMTKPLLTELNSWKATVSPKVKGNQIEPPDQGNDRAVDNWLPLFSVANIFGSVWRQKCEEAYQALTAPAEKTLQTQLLADIKETFAKANNSRIASTELIEKLCSDPEKPWATHSNGRKLTPYQMAKLLKLFDIRPSVMRSGGKTIRGYEESMFQDAFDRYLK